MNTDKNIQYHKEFFQLISPHTHTGISQTSHLDFTSSQLFTQYITSIYRNHNRILLFKGTGSGKTIESLAAALNYVRDFPDPENKPSIIIIGFTKGTFRRELIRYPEFGFVTREELESIKRMQQIASRGIQSDIDAFKKKIAEINRRLTNSDIKFIFFGYKELLNRVFPISIDSPDTSFIQLFNNSFIICDEIHSVYNSLEKNNWGIALQYILDNTSATRVLFLSATPLNNNAEEIVDLINLIVPKESRQNKLLDRNDFFTKEGALKPSADKLLMSYLTGRVSALREIDKSAYPSMEIVGKSIESVPLLKFILCDMAPIQLELFKDAVVDTGKLASDELYVLDTVFPVPNVVGGNGDKNMLINYDSDDSESSQWSSDTFRDVWGGADNNEIKFVFQTQELRKAYANVSNNWLVNNNISVKRLQGGVILSGKYFADNLKTISGKYYKLVSDVKNIIANGGGKSFIYHNIVHMSGVMFIAGIFEEIGFIPYGSSPVDSTIDVNTGLTLAEMRKKNIADKHIPARYILAHSDIDRLRLMESLDVFNSPANSRGEHIFLLIGSRIIRESFDLKCIRNVLVCSKPDNIPTLEQIIGRAVRRGSHNDLPQEQRTVKVMIYASIDTKNPKDAFEINKYREKINDYIKIQQIQKIMYTVAMDSVINWKRIQTVVSDNSLGVLKYNTGTIPKAFTSSLYHDAFFRQATIDKISYIIKSLFLIKPLYTEKELFASIRKPPLNVAVNTELFSDIDITITLAQLVYNIRKTSTSDNHSVTKFISAYKNIDTDEYKSINSEQDIARNSKDITIIDRGGIARAIVVKVVNNTVVYLAVPYNIETDTVYITNVEDFIVASTATNPDRITKEIHIDVMGYIQSTVGTVSFNALLVEFMNKFPQLDNEETILDALCSHNIDFHKELAELCIKRVQFLMISAYYGKPLMLSNTDKFFIKMLAGYIYLNNVIIVNNVSHNLNSTVMKILINIDKIFAKRQKITIVIMATVQVLTYACTLVKSPYFASYLPIGHNIDVPIPIYYISKHKNDWIPIQGQLDILDFKKENDIIVGMLVSPAKGLGRVFKVRPPIHIIKDIGDRRKIERGTTCDTKQKSELLKICDKLEIDTVSNTSSITDICREIKFKLIYNEINAIKENTGIKWMYFN
jgi:hypothetical protein